jgi:hypothetical protein
VTLINDSRTRRAQALVSTTAQAGPARLDRLLGPSAYATGGVTLGGESFGPLTTTGVLPPPQTTALAPHAGVYRVTLPPASAALLAIPFGSNGTPSAFADAARVDGRRTRR